MTKKKDCFTVFAMTLTDKPALAIEVASFYFMLKILRRAQNDKNKRYNGKRDPCGNAQKTSKKQVQYKNTTFAADLRKIKSSERGCVTGSFKFKYVDSLLM